MRIFSRAFTALALCLTFSSNAQFLSNELARSVKKSKVIIGLTSDSLTNKALLKAVESSWKLTPIYDKLPLKDALKKMKEERGITVIQLGIDKSTNTTKTGNFKVITSSSGYYIGLNTKGKNYADVIQYISYNSEAQFVFGLTALQDAVNTIIDENLSGMAKLPDTYETRKPKLKGKTLYVWKELVDKDITLAEIKSAFGGEVKLVDFEEFERVIAEHEEDGVYFNSASVPVGDTHVFLAYLVGSGDHKMYGAFRNGKRPELTNKTLKNLEN